MKKKIEASDLQSKMILQNYGIKTVCATNIKVYTQWSRSPSPDTKPNIHSKETE